MKRQVQLKNKTIKEYKGLVPQLKQRIKLKSKLLLVENFEKKADSSYLCKYMYGWCNYFLNLI